MLGRCQTLLMLIERFMMSKTTAMVVFVPDPFIALAFKKCLPNLGVDQLLVQVNGARKHIVDYIANIYKDHKVIKHYDHSNQGIGFDELYPYAKGDVLITLCSDNFVFNKEVIKTYVDMIPEFDAVGSKGLHATPPYVADEIAEKLGTVRLNPFMSFWNKKKLINKLR